MRRPLATALVLVLLLPTAGCGGSVPWTTPEGTPTTQAGQQTAWTVTVERVVDGDTVEVRFPDGSVEAVRLLGVDTPEVRGETDPAAFEGIPDTEAGRAWLRDWGHRASEFARAELLGREIRIETDPTADRRGGFGRLLVYVSVDGEAFNLALIEQGYARLYDTSFGERDAFAAAEERARREGVGLWGFEGATTGVAEGPLAVAEIHADAAGDDHENLNDEYVVFENTGGERLDLSGWQVRDAAGHAYTFPDGFVLGAGATVTLRTGSGSNSERDLYWDAESAVWNNGGDTIVVTDAEGTEVLRRRYG